MKRLRIIVRIRDKIILVPRGIRIVKVGFLITMSPGILKEAVSRRYTITPKIKITIPK
jgi:hypothetical protein